MLFFKMVSNNRNFKHNVKITNMRSFIIPLASAVVLLGSCSVYRSGQTPDDVYYSPSPVETRAAAAGGDEYVAAENDRDDGRRYDGYDDYATSEDRWLRMRVRDRYRWSAFDDYYYSPYYSPFYSPYNPYSSMGWGGVAPGFSLGLGLGYGLGYGSLFGSYYNPYGNPFYDPFMSYYGWNSYYNPYYRNIVVVNPKTNPAGYTRSRTFDLNRYSNSATNRRTLSNRQNYNYRPRYNNANSNSTNRRVYSNSSSDNRQRNSYSRPSQDRPVRTYNPSNNSSYSPSSSGSSGSSSRSSGGGAGSRPGRR